MGVPTPLAKSLPLVASPAAIVQGSLSVSPPSERKRLPIHKISWKEYNGENGRSDGMFTVQLSFASVYRINSSMSETPLTPATPENSDTTPTTTPRKRILIGSQRTAATSSDRPTSLRPQAPTPLRPVNGNGVASVRPSEPTVPNAPATAGDSNHSANSVEKTNVTQTASAGDTGDTDGGKSEERRNGRGLRRFREERQPLQAPKSHRRVQLPNLREGLDDELQAEFDAMMGGGSDATSGDSVDAMMKADEKRTQETTVEVGAKCQGRVVSLGKDCMFVELGGYEQGVLMYRSMPGIESGEVPLPKEGEAIEVYVSRYNQGEGLYVLTLPNAASVVEDWSDLSEGLVVEAKVTGVNKGGLECEVNYIRGFIPMGQVSLYRVEHPEELIGEKWNCLITECNPMRRNLILSRRSILEREREAAKQAFLAELSVGQIYDGVVRRLMNFGAFVELGSGVDGLLPISQLSWARVNHPSDVLSEGQAIRVRVERYDEQTGKISLSYKDLLENPWTKAENMYVVGSEHTGTVTKLMDFGAFVQLEPGVEGLVHVSEIAYTRVNRVADVLKEGETVQVQVTSFDAQNHRIGLSMKACLAPPAPVATESSQTDEPASEKPEEKPTTPAKAVRQFNGPLRGGTAHGGSEGEKFGLKW